MVFAVKLSDGSVLVFNAQTGAAAPAPTETEFEGTTTLPVGATPKVDFAKARELALAQAPNHTVKKIELETEDGVLAYTVKFTDGSKVIINAIDGSIVKVKVEAKTDNKTQPSDANKAKSVENSNGKSQATSTHNSGSSSNSGSSHDSPEAPKSTTNRTDSQHLSTDSSSHGGNSGSGSGSSGHHDD